MRRLSLLDLTGIVLILVILAGTAGAQAPQPNDVANVQGAVGTGFTYQGQLKNASGPVNATCDFQFSLWNAASSGSPPTGGAQVGITQTLSVTVTNGLFTAVLNGGNEFGRNAFAGEARWLEIAVRCAGDSEFSTLTPRQALTATPYALYSSGNWSLNGNGSTNVNNFLGTLDDMTLTLRVSNTVALRIVPAVDPYSGFAPNIIGGDSGNQVAPGVYGATIGGGGVSGLSQIISGSYATISGGLDNTASGQAAVVGGGSGNTASGLYPTIGGGFDNTVSGQTAIVGGGYRNAASGEAAMVGGGSYNIAEGIGSTIGGGNGNTAHGFLATIGGGSYNIASNQDATIGGGLGNAASGSGATIGGGSGNSASYLYATVGGGTSNTASGSGSAVCGGSGNTASGMFAAIPGGTGNIAGGRTSFAAGCGAKAQSSGTFVWVDSNCDMTPITTTNGFYVRASGGVVFRTNLYRQPESGVILNSGASAWSSLSDRYSKDNIVTLDGRDVLARLAKIPVATWNYKSQAPSIRHVGPMAQDFYTAFGVGEDDQHISTVDADGVALAAIQGLYQIVQEKDAAITALEVRVAELEKASQPAPFNVFNLASVLAFAGVAVLLMQHGVRRMS